MDLLRWKTQIVDISFSTQGVEWNDCELLASFTNNNTNTNPAEVEVWSNWQGWVSNLSFFLLFFQEAEEDVDNDEIPEATG